jgi:hypothetical protein
MHQIVTANRLDDGEVVYFTKDQTWSRVLEDSVVIEDKAEAASLLIAAETPEQELEVVGPYLAKVNLEDGQAIAINQRESIRAKGPTVHPHFGKQAEAGGQVNV